MQHRDEDLRLRRGAERKEIWKYLRKLADETGLLTEEDENILSWLYDCVDVKRDNVPLAQYLGDKRELAVYRGPARIYYPFGCNASQKKAVETALTHQVSIIQGPPGTGKTQTINYYNINELLYFVDLPGYGYAKVSKEMQAKWGKLIERYLHTSKQLRIVFLLVDIRHDPSANDKLMYDWIVNNGFNPVIIATKLDKLKRSQVAKHVKAIREGLNLVKGTPIFPYSALSKQGRDEIWEFIEEYVLNPQEEIEETVEE